MIGDDRGDKEIGGCERRDVELESDREHPDKQHKRSEVRGEEQDESCERDRFTTRRDLHLRASKIAGEEQ